VQYAQDYAWEKIAKQIVDVYKELVRNEPVLSDSSRLL